MVGVVGNYRFDRLRHLPNFYRIMINGARIDKYKATTGYNFPCCYEVNDNSFICSTFVTDFLNRDYNSPPDSITVSLSLEPFENSQVVKLSGDGCLRWRHYQNRRWRFTYPFMSDCIKKLKWFGWLFPPKHVYYRIDIT